MEVYVGDIFVANKYFFRVYEVHSNYVMVEWLGTKVLSSDFDIYKYREAVMDKSKFRKVGSRIINTFNDSTYLLTLEIAPSDKVFQKFKMMIDKKEEMLKSRDPRVYLTNKDKYKTPIMYKTVMTNDYEYLPPEVIEQIKQVKKECEEEEIKMTASCTQ